MITIDNKYIVTFSELGKTVYSLKIINVLDRSDLQLSFLNYLARLNIFLFRLIKLGINTDELSTTQTERIIALIQKVTYHTIRASCLPINQNGF